MEVESDLSDRPRPRVRRERLEARPCRLVDARDIVGMDPHRRVNEIGMAVGELERRLR